MPLVRWLTAFPRYLRHWDRVRRISFGVGNSLRLVILVATRSRVQRCFRLRFGAFSFFARPMDFVAIEEIVFKQQYHFLHELLMGFAPEATIIDAGANIGLFSLFVLNCKPDANVFALEPSNDTFAVLELNCSSGGLSNWKAYHFALWDIDGSVPFQDAPMSVSSHVAMRTAEGMPVVPATSLATFLERYVTGRIALLKLDIEGSEGVVLQGSTRVLPLVDNLVVEVHPSFANTNDVVTTLDRHFARLQFVSSRTTKKATILASENRSSGGPR